MKMTSSDIRLEGIANEIVMARVNIDVFQEIQKNWNRIKELNDIEKQIFNYLKISSINQSILHLGRLFDKPSSTYPTFCLAALFNSINSEGLAFQNHLLTEKQWNAFTLKFQNVFDTFPNLSLDNPESFYCSIQNFIKDGFEKGINENFILKRLKNWRDKKVAHSEKYEYGNFISFEEAKILLEISIAISEYVNTFFQSDLIVVTNGRDSRFIKELIEKYCG